MRLSIIRFISSTLPFQRSRRTCLESALLLRKPAWKSPVAHPYADEDADCLSCQRSVRYAFLRCAWQSSTIWLPRSSFFKDKEFCKTCQHCVCTRNLRQALTLSHNFKSLETAMGFKAHFSSSGWTTGQHLYIP